MTAAGAIGGVLIGGRFTEMAVGGLGGSVGVRQGRSLPLQYVMIRYALEGQATVLKIEESALALEPLVVPKAQLRVVPGPSWKLALGKMVESSSYTGRNVFFI